MAKADDRPALERSLVSAERGQHGDVVVERVTDAPGAFHARAMPVVERMFRRGQLSERQAHAGMMLYEDWAIGIMCARDGDAGGGSMFDPAGYRDRQLDAATRYRKAREAVGGRMWPCLFHIACLEWSVERFSNECGAGMDRKQWSGILKLSLDVLADFYGMD